MCKYTAPISHLDKVDLFKDRILVSSQVTPCFYWFQLEIVDSIFRGCSGTNAGAMDVDEDAKVDVEFSVFTNNVGKVYAGAAHVHDDGKVEFETCAFSGSPVPKEFVRYVQEDFADHPKIDKYPQTRCSKEHLSYLTFFLVYLHGIIVFQQD